MNNSRFGILVFAGLALIVLGLSVFTVDERELAVKLKFGRVVTADFEPGLHFKIPFINNVRKFPRRIQTIRGAEEEIFTFERKELLVDFFVKWRVVDSVQYYTSTGGYSEVAGSRLEEIIKNAIVTEFGKRTVQEAISVQRTELVRDMLESSSLTARELGVELVDVRVKQVEFPPAIRDSVYKQMSQERARVAAELRAQGREIATELRADADLERTIIESEAYRDAQKLRGEGDAIAAQIYAGAYEKDPEFYAFYRSIEAYKKSMGKSGDLLVLDPNNEFFRYLNQSDGKQ
jgi:membrane protease subunit HflC